MSQADLTGLRLTAQVELTEARTNQVEALHGHTIAVATLHKAVGSGVRFE